MNFHSSSICNSSKLKTTHFSLGKWSNKLAVPHRGILLSNEKECTINIPNNLDESPDNYSEWKKSVPKRLQPIWFHVLNIIEMTTLQKWTTEVAQVLEGVRPKGRGYGYKRAGRGILVGMEMFCLLAVSLPACWLCYCIIGLQDVPTRGSWLEAKEISLYYFLQLHVNLHLCHDLKV